MTRRLIGRFAMTRWILSFCMFATMLVFSSPCFADVLLYDPFPVSDGYGDPNYIYGKTYTADTDLSGDNNTIDATDGAYAGGWQWPANWNVVHEGLSRTSGDLQLEATGGSLDKLHGTTSFRNYTLRKFAGATATTTYFSFLVRFTHFGDGVGTRVGLGNLGTSLSMTAYLTVSKTGLAKAVMYDSTSQDAVQLETDRTYLVVGKLEYNVTDGGSNTSEHLTFWVQPQLGLQAEPTSDQSDLFVGWMEAMSNANDVVSNYIGARASESLPVAVAVDEYRIATTWQQAMPATASLILYDPVPIGDGAANQTYIADQSLSGTNSDVLAATGSYNGAWQWSANYGATSQGLDYIAGTKKLLTTGGAFHKLHGDTTYRNLTVRPFDGTSAKTTYFSCLIQWDHFGNDVDTRFGLARLNSTISMMAYLSVNAQGVAKSYLYNTSSANTGQLETGVTYLIVGRLEYDIDTQNSERLTLWIQPALDRDIAPESGETGAYLSQFQVTATGDSVANYIGGRGGEAAPVDFRIDEYRVGWAYAAVVPSKDYYCVTEKWVTTNLSALSQPLGTRLPVLIWGNPIQYDTSDADYVGNLYQRGLCYTPNVATDRTAGAAAKISALQTLGGYRPMIMQSCGQATFANAPHDYLGSETSSTYPCLGYYLDKKTVEATRTAGLLTDVTNLGMSPNLFLFDWENWCRWIYEIDNPDTDAMLTDRRTHATACGRCVANLTQQDLASNQAYLNAVEAKRALVLKDGLYAPVRAAFPDALVGNYWTTSFVRSDQPLGNVSRAVGWHGGGAELSMFVGYGNRYDKMKSSTFVGWNTFRYFLQRYSEETREAVGNEIQIPWTCRLLPSDAMEDENGVNHQIFAANGTPIPLYAWPRSSYREYLRHCMLRGARTFAIFYPQTDPGTYAQYLGYQRELSDVLQVVNEMHACDDVLDTGTVLNKSDLPGNYDSTTDAVVWSGVATADKAVIRAVSFTGATVVVQVSVFGRTENVNATVQGTTTIINR